MKPPRPGLPAWLAPSAHLLEAYAALLADAGVTQGLIGPREVPRLWERHLLNCAVVAEPEAGLIPEGASVADVGSGAGLPGLVWAIVRPDLRVTLVEPLLRRATFLTQAVSDLGLDTRVTVIRGRGEEQLASGAWTPVDIVTARAVAPLSKLLGWTVPLLREGGHLLALKGSSAAEEVAAAQAEAAAVGLADLRVRTLGEGVVDPVTTVVTGIRRAAQ